MSGVGVFAFGAVVALVASEIMSESIWAAGGLRFSAILLAIGGVLYFSMASRTFDRRPKVNVEVGLDGLRLPMHSVPFRALQSLRVEPTDTSYSTLELLLEDGEVLRLSMLDAERVAHLIRERHALYKRLTAPRERAHADGYRGVRVVEESESIEDGLRQEGWAEENLEAVLAVALVIPEAER